MGPSKGGAPKGGVQKGGAPKGGGQKFRAFFSLLLPEFSVFFLSLGVRPVEFFWWCLKRWVPEMCTFGVLGLSCASPPGLQKHHQNSTKEAPREGEKNENCGGKREKKAKFWAVREEGCPAEGCPVEGCPAEGCPAEGCPAEGYIGNGVQGSGFRVQFRFLGTKTEIEQKQNEERDE